MAEFISSNPVTRGFNAEEQRRTQQTGAEGANALQELQFKELQRTRDVEVAIDRFLRERDREMRRAQRPTGPTGPAQGPAQAPAPGVAPAVPASAPGAQVAPAAPGAPAQGQSSLRAAVPFGGFEGLSDIPGAGRFQFEIEKTNVAAAQERTVKLADRAFESLQGNNPAQMQWLFGMVGIKLPIEVLQDARKRQQLARAQELLKLYGNDYLQFGKALVVANEAGTPEGGLNLQEGFRQFPPTNQAQSSFGSQDRLLQRARFLAEKTGMSEGDALRLVQDPRARTQIFLAFLKAETEFGDPGSIDEQRARAQESTDKVLDHFGGGGTGTATPAPAAGEPPPGAPLASVTPLGSPTSEQEALLEQNPTTPPFGPLGAPLDAAGKEANQNSVENIAGSVVRDAVRSEPPPGIGPSGAPQGAAGPQGAPPAGTQGPLPLPRGPDGAADPSQLIPGQTYLTGRGPAIWNGNQFISAAVQ